MKKLFLALMLVFSICLVGCNKVSISDIINTEIEKTLSTKQDGYKEVYLEKFNCVVNSEEKVDNETINANITITQKSIKDVCSLSIKKQFQNILNDNYTNDQSMIDAFKEIENVASNDYDIEIKLIDGVWTITDKTFLFDTSK